MGFDLLDYYRGKLSLRRLLVLVSQLPDGSHVTRRELGGWSHRDYQLVNLMDQVCRVSYLLECQIYQASGGSGDAPTPPEPAWRPELSIPEPEVQPEPESTDVQWATKDDVQTLLSTTSIRKQFNEGSGVSG